MLNQCSLSSSTSCFHDIASSTAASHRQTSTRGSNRESVGEFQIYLVAKRMKCVVMHNVGINLIKIFWHEAALRYAIYINLKVIVY